MAYGTETARRLRTRTMVRTPPPTASLDIATVVGISAAFLLIATAIFLGGQPAAFIDIPAIFIVVGGTFGVTVACFSAGDLLASFRVFGQTVFRTAQPPVEIARHLMQLSDTARRKGHLSLQDYLPDMMHNGLLYRGIAMVVDGSEADEVERIMQSELQATTERHARAVGMLRKAAEISPAMGLIGTLVGLVQMLGTLEDPSTIGPSMAVALLTTFYGAILANLVFTPLASKLERNSAEDALMNEMYVMAAASIARQENPRRLEMLLNTVLPPENKIVYFQ